MKKGTPLFVIEPEPYQVKLEQAQAAEEGAKAALVTGRGRVRAASGAAGQGRLDPGQSRPGARQPRHRPRQPAAGAGQYPDRADQPRLHAGDGAVRRGRDRAPGVDRRAGRRRPAPTELATIVQLDPIYVNFNISEHDVQRVRAGAGAARATAAELSTRSRSTSACRPRPDIRTRAMLDYAAPTLSTSHRHAAGARHLREPERVAAAGLFRARAGADRGRSRRCWCRTWRSAATRAAATCWWSTPTTWSSSARSTLGQTDRRPARGRERPEAGRPRGGGRPPATPFRGRRSIRSRSARRPRPRATGRSGR